LLRHTVGLVAHRSPPFANSGRVLPRQHLVVEREVDTGSATVAVLARLIDDPCPEVDRSR
jgi:hypothetical protein